MSGLHDDNGAGWYRDDNEKDTPIELRACNDLERDSRSSQSSVEILDGGSRPSIGYSEDHELLRENDREIALVQRGRTKERSCNCAALDYVWLKIHPAADKTSEIISGFRAATYADLGALVGYVLLGFLPSFLRGSAVRIVRRVRGLKSEEKGAAARKPRRTAYLDGVRGWAALFVAVYHYNLIWFPQAAWGYGAGAHVGVQWLCLLPIVRLYASGPTMVHIFFALSGLVLSHKPISLMRQQSFAEVLTVLASSGVRRGGRLFIPMFFASLLVVFYGYIGLLAWVNGNFPPEWKESDRHWDVPVFQSYFAAVRAIFASILNYSVIWDWTMRANEFDVNTWTLPIEFASSLLIFLFLLMTSRFRIWVRIACEMLVYRFLYTYSWRLQANFFAGVMLAELDIYLMSKDAQWLTKRLDSRRLFRVAQETFWSCVLVVSLWYMTTPMLGSDNTPGYRTLMKFARTQGWVEEDVRACSAQLMILCLVMSKGFLRRFFETRLSMYLGRVSFSLYLLHGPLAFSLSRLILMKTWTITGRTTPTTYLMGAFAGACIFWFICFWIADIFCEHFEEKPVRFCRWFEQKLISSPAMKEQKEEGRGQDCESVLPIVEIQAAP